MVRLSFTSENIPTPEEFQQMLTEAMAESNPVEELLELAHELQEYERKYEMRSSEFFERFQRGELGDDMEWIDWAGTYQLFQRLKRRVELALMQVAIGAQVEATPT
ncbi:MAG: hypothetical protein ACETWR_00780 [Anaerolineae bacterium]